MLCVKLRQCGQSAEQGEGETRGSGGESFMEKAKSLKREMKEDRFEQMKEEKGILETSLSRQSSTFQTDEGI